MTKDSKETMLAKRILEVRDYALNTAEFGDAAVGEEFFDAIVARVETRNLSSQVGISSQEENPLLDSLMRRLAWGELPEQVLADGREVCRRVLGRMRESQIDPQEMSLLVRVICEVDCDAAAHVSLLVATRSKVERGRQRRETMVHRQLSGALQKQEERIAHLQGQPER